MASLATFDISLVSMHLRQSDMVTDEESDKLKIHFSINQEAGLLLVLILTFDAMSWKISVFPTIKLHWGKRWGLWVIIFCFQKQLFFQLNRVTHTITAYPFLQGCVSPACSSFSFLHVADFWTIFAWGTFNEDTSDRFQLMKFSMPKMRHCASINTSVGMRNNISSTLLIPDWDGNFVLLYLEIIKQQEVSNCLMLTTNSICKNIQVSAVGFHQIMTEADYSTLSFKLTSTYFCLGFILVWASHPFFITNIKS